MAVNDRMTGFSFRLVRSREPRRTGGFEESRDGESNPGPIHYE